MANEDSAFYLMGVMVGQSINGKVATADLASTDTGKGAELVAYKAPYTGAVARTQAEKNAESLSLDDFKSPSDPDDTIAFQKALDTGEFFTLPDREIVLSATVDGGDKGLRFSGQANTVIKAAPGFVGSTMVTASGSLAALPALASNKPIGDRFLSFASDHGLAVGDVILSWLNVDGSFNSARTYYKSGQMFQVVDIVSSTQVRTAEENYETQTTSFSFYKMNPIPVEISNVSFESDISGLQILKFSFAKDYVLDNVRFLHSGESCVVPDKSYGGVINECNTTNPGGASGDYGLVISNCQGLRVNGGHYHSRRHGITHGGDAAIGSVTCRNVRLFGVTTSNSPESGVESLSYHGNAEDCAVYGSRIYGGLTLAGANVSAHGCYITCSAYGLIVQYTEVLGGDLTLSDCTLVSTINPQPNNMALLNVGVNSTAIGSFTNRLLNLNVKECRLKATGMSELTSFLGFRNNGSSAFIQVNIDDVKLETNNLGQVLLSRLESGTANSEGFSITNLSGTLPQGVLLHNAEVSGYRNKRHRLPRESGRVSLTLSSGSAVSSAAPSTFRYKYPRAPVVQATLAGVGNIGNVPAVPAAQSVTESGFTGRAYSATAANWTATVTADYCWTAELCEF